MSRKAVIGLMLVIVLVVAMPLVPATGARAASDYVIGVSVPSESDPFFAGMSNGAEAAAEDLGIKVLLTTSDNDPAAELANVQDLIEQGVDALVISPVNGILSADVAAAAHEAAVPVVLAGADLDLSTLEDIEVASAVVPYNGQGGWLAGSLLCEAVGAGTVAELVGRSNMSLARSGGFNAYVSDSCPDVMVKTVDIADLDRDAVTDAVLELLTGETEISGLIAFDELSTLAAVDAAAISRTPDTVKFVGFNATDDVMVALQSGRLLAVVTPVGWMLGLAGVSTAADYLAGEEVYTSVLVNMGVLNQDSVVAFRGGPGSGQSGPGSDPRSGSFQGGPGSGQFEGGPGSGQFEGGPGSGQFEGGPGSGQFEGGPGSGQFEGGPGSGQFEGGPGSGQFEGGPGSGQFENNNNQGQDN